MPESFIELTIPYRDVHLLQLRCRAVARGFSGEAAAYFGIDGTTTVGPGLSDFAAGLDEYPISRKGGVPLLGAHPVALDDAAVVAAIRLQPFGEGKRGQVYIEVELTDELETAAQPALPAVAQFPVWVDHASLQRWSKDLLDLMAGRIDKAVIEGTL